MTPSANVTRPMNRSPVALSANSMVAGPDRKPCGIIASRLKISVESVTARIPVRRTPTMLASGGKIRL